MSLSFKDVLTIKKFQQFFESNTGYQIWTINKNQTSNGGLSFSGRCAITQKIKNMESDVEFNHTELVNYFAICNENICRVCFGDTRYIEIDKVYNLMTYPDFIKKLKAEYLKNNKKTEFFKNQNLISSSVTDSEME